MTEATITIEKMMKTLPYQLQDRVVEHMCEYIATLQDEARWKSSFSRTQNQLVLAARQAREEIAEGKAMPHRDTVH